MSTPSGLLDSAIELAREAGRALMEGFGAPQAVDRKGDNSNVVTAADLRSERIVVQGIRRRYPGHSVIAEETGCDLRDSEYTWVVDPLDGTSNYAAGLPWFGVLICVLRATEPIAGVLHTPVDGSVYAAEAGAGALRNGERISVTATTDLADVLWAYGMDGGSSDAEAERNVLILARLLRRVRNIRATNSLVDAACVADGRLGGMLNQSTRVWDIAAPSLIVREAGGLYSGVTGESLRFDLSSAAACREYAVLAGAPGPHREVAAIVRETLAKEA